MWADRRKKEIEEQIHDAEASIVEARLVRAEVLRQANAWEVIQARRAHDGLGVELELSFQRKKPSDER